MVSLFLLQQGGGGGSGLLAVYLPLMHVLKQRPNKVNIERKRILTEIP